MSGRRTHQPAGPLAGAMNTQSRLKEGFEDEPYSLLQQPVSSWASSIWNGCSSAPPKAPETAIRPTISSSPAKTNLRITLAVAGFGRDELNVTVEDRQLVIRGKQSDAADKQFLHRGIAARQFQRAFVLAEGIEVTAAELENGLLTIELARPESRKRHSNDKYPDAVR